MVVRGEHDEEFDGFTRGPAKHGDHTPIARWRGEDSLAQIGEGKLRDLAHLHRDPVAQREPLGAHGFISMKPAAW